MAAAAGVSWLIARDHPVWVAVAGGIAAGTAAGVLVDRIVLWPARLRAGGPLGRGRALIAGLAALAAFGAIVPEPERPTYVLHAGIVRIGGFEAPRLMIDGIVACLVVLVALFAAIRVSRYGLGLRAVGSNRAAARAAGLAPEPLHVRTALVASACGALAATTFLTAPDYFAGRSTPFDLPIAALAAVALGGLSSLPATVLGAFVVAAAQAFAPTGDAGDAVAGALLLLAVAVLPRGLVPATRLRAAERT